jgi:hypothetical protein
MSRKFHLVFAASLEVLALAAALALFLLLAYVNLDE